MHKKFVFSQRPQYICFSKQPNLEHKRPTQPDFLEEPRCGYTAFGLGIRIFVGGNLGGSSGKLVEWNWLSAAEQATNWVLPLQLTMCMEVTGGQSSVQLKLIKNIKYHGYT